MIEEAVLNSEEADCLVRLIEIATEGHWPSVASEIQSLGYKPSDVAAACKKLTDAAGVDVIIGEDDF